MCYNWNLKMTRLTLFSIFIAATFALQAYSAPFNVEVSVAVRNKIYRQGDEEFPQSDVTEPAWVTELLGPTEFPPSTTKRPTLPDRVRNTISTGIKQVQDSISTLPNRINQLFHGIQQGAQNIIRPGASRVTTKKPSFPTAVQIVQSPSKSVGPSVVVNVI